MRCYKLKERAIPIKHLEKSKWRSYVEYTEIPHE